MTPHPKLLHLESVRGLAAAAVVACHVVFAFAPPDRGGTPTVAGWESPAGRGVARLLLHPIGDGRLPVAVFFVLSGVVLSQGYLRSGGRADLGAACVRRFVRLGVPAGAATVLAWAVWRAGWADVGPAADVLAADGVSARWLRLLGPPDLSLSAAVGEACWGLYFLHPPSPPHRLFNCALWTMRVELYGSLLVYAFLGVFGRHPRAARLAGVAAGVAAAGGWVYPALFLAGVWLAFVRHARPAEGLSPAVGGGLLAAALWLGGQGEYLIDWWLPVPLVNRTVDSLDLFATPAAVLLVGAVLFCRPLAAALSARPLVRLGGISFGLYLAHMPVLLSAGVWTFAAVRPAAGHGPAVVAAGAVVFGLSAAGGWVLTVLADRPAADLGRRLADRLLRDRPAAGRASVAGTPVTPVGGTVPADAGDPVPAGARHPLLPGGGRVEGTKHRSGGLRPLFSWTGL